MHLEELEDPEKYAEEGVKVITRQEYVSRLHELKDEINRSWRANDRVTSLKLSIKVSLICYGQLFVYKIFLMPFLIIENLWE